MSSLLDYAEETSHAFLGGSPNMENTHSLLQTTLAHGLGYLTSPLRYGMEKTISSLAGPSKVSRTAVSDSSNKKLTSLPQDMSQRKKKPLSKAAQRFAAISRAIAAQRKPGFKRAGRPTFSRPVRAPRRGGRFVRPQRTVPLTTRRPGPSRSVRAPVQQSKISSSGMMMSFAAGKRAGCLMLRGTQYIGDLVSANPTTGIPNAALALGGDLTKLTAQFLVMPQNLLYFTAPVNTMALMFERYRMKTRLEYKTRVGSNIPGNFKLVYSEDPVAFFAQTGKDSVVEPDSDTFKPYAVTTSDICGYPNVHSGPAWTDWFSGWSHAQPKQDMNYIPATTYTTNVLVEDTPAIDVRQPIAGSWLVSGAGLFVPTTHNLAVSMGEVWVHYELELCDIVSTTISNPTDTPGPHLAAVAPTHGMRRPLRSSTVPSVRTLQSLSLECKDEEKNSEDEEVRPSRSRKGEKKKNVG